MRHRHSMILVAMLVGLGANAVAMPAGTHPASAPARATTVVTAAAPASVPRPGSPGCPIAARVELSLADEFDEVRAIVDTSTPGAAAAVTVLSGRSDRQLSAFGAGVWGLQLGSPLPAGRVIVSVEPVIDAPASACVDQVELLRRGAVVARVIPR
jgi:hypothetical protein